MEQFYDEIIIPVPSDTHFKNAIIKRNDWFLENSELLVAYVVRETGGAALCLKKAIKMGKEIRYVDPIHVKEEEDR